VEGRLLFESQLRELGLTVEARTDGRTLFEYETPIGPFMGEQLRIGLDVPPDFDRTPPGGPHVSPRLAQERGGKPGGVATNVHTSAFGPDFEYWSRPYPPPWGRDGRSAEAYLAFIRKLLAEL
jgi:hypothetical protein